MIFAGMDLYVYNKDFMLVGLIDNYTSLIWTDRYNEPGEFELEILCKAELKDILQEGYYCKINYSDHWCMIEKIEVNKKEDDPAYLIVTGRSLEFILSRRVIEKETKFGNEYEGRKVNVQESVFKLLDNCIISPKNGLRLIKNFTYKQNWDKEITKLKFAKRYLGENLLDAIKDICEDKHIGFQILLDEKNRFVFSLYKGQDRSIDQNTDEYVIFSPYYDNLQSSNYYSSIEEYANLMFVQRESDETGGEGKLLSAYNNLLEPHGIDRIEIYENESTFKEKGQVQRLDDDKLLEKAKKSLANDYKIHTAFEGEIVPDFMYEYRKNYNVGDKVNFQDEYGNSGVVYISEVVITFDENGLTILPTFEEIDWTEEEDEEETNK